MSHRAIVVVILSRMTGMFQGVKSVTEVPENGDATLHKQNVEQNLPKPPPSGFVYEVSVQELLAPAE